jgi:N-hydroxyarylamine O-acetyltransferase
MDLKRYLKRINVTDKITPDLTTLQLLQRQHLLNIPFENLDIHSGRKIILDKEKLFHKIVDEGRGGFCYELNGMFYELLSALVFNVKMIAAGVSDDGVNYGPDFDHMALIVKLNNEEYLADVGFGDSFITPLKFQLDEIRYDENGFFRISKADENHHFILFQSADGEKFVQQYKFTLIPRKLNDYDEICLYHQTSPESHFTQKVVCSMATESGRITLSNLKLIITENGVKKQEEINEREFQFLLKKHFNIELSTKLIFPPKAILRNA